MRCLNAPPNLNSLEERILERCPTEVKHVAIVGAGDGRLARALQEKLGSDLKVSLVEPQTVLHRYLDDFKDVGTEPWDLSWHKARTKANGPYDYLIFYNIHNYWQGGLNTFKSIVDLLSDQGHCWITFLNSLARMALLNVLPSNLAAFGSLNNPVRLAPSTDYASWRSLLTVMRAPIDSVWGVLDPDAFKFCKQHDDGKSPDPVTWELNGMKFEAKTLADAYLWGAPIMGLEFHLQQDGDSTNTLSQFSGAPFNPSLYQALLIPFPETSQMENDPFPAELEARAWGAQKENKLSPLGDFVLKQIDKPEEIKKVLLVGAGWGKDLILLNKTKPDWKWTGLEVSEIKVAAGQSLVKKEGLTLTSFDPEKPLPFKDQSFDIVLSFGYFSTIYSPLAKVLVKEFLRVAQKGIYHLEDSRGPEFSLKLKNYSLTSIYEEHGYEPGMQPVLLDGKQSGLYLIKVSK